MNTQWEVCFMGLDWCLVSLLGRFVTAVGRFGWEWQIIGLDARLCKECGGWESDSVRAEWEREGERECWLGCDMSNTWELYGLSCGLLIYIDPV